MYDRQQKYTPGRRARGVLDPGREHEQISDSERVFLTERLEDHLAFENVDAHRAAGVVRRQVTARRQSQNRKAKRTFLDERSRASAVTRNESLIYSLLVTGKVADEHFA
jgi:hypothetical protein